MTVYYVGNNCCDDEEGDQASDEDGHSHPFDHHSPSFSFCIFMISSTAVARPSSLVLVYNLMSRLFLNRTDISITDLMIVHSPPPHVP